jgi:hypothetical protein
VLSATLKTELFPNFHYVRVKKKKFSTSHDIFWETANSNDFSIHFVLQQKHMETWQNASNLLAEKATCTNL